MHTKIKGLMFGVVIVLSMVVFIGAFAQDDKKGIVTFADGQVTRNPAASEQWLTANVNTQVLGGDKVRTYRQSRAELDLASLDIIRLAPRTIIDIIKLYEETKDNKLKTSIHIEEGELWASVHEIDVDTDFDISAPVAAAAITGTVLRMKVDPDSTTQLKVYKGEVQISKKTEGLTKPVENKSLAPKQVHGPTQVPGPKEVTVDEWVKIVKAMQQITIDKKGQILSYSGFSPTDAEESDDWVQWNHRLDNRRLERIKELMKK